MLYHFLHFAFVLFGFGLFDETLHPHVFGSGAFCDYCFGDSIVFCMLVGLLTLWTNSIKIKAIKLQADFNDRQSRIVDGRVAILGTRCLGRCLFVAVFLDIPRLSADSIVDSNDDDVAGFRRKCFLNILYILGAFASVMLVGDLDGVCFGFTLDWHHTNVNSLGSLN